MIEKNEWDLSQIEGDFNLVDDIEILDTAEFEFLDSEIDDIVEMREEQEKASEISDENEFQSILDREPDINPENVIEPSTLIEENLHEPDEEIVAGSAEEGEVIVVDSEAETAAKEAEPEALEESEESVPENEAVAEEETGEVEYQVTEEPEKVEEPEKEAQIYTTEEKIEEEVIDSESLREGERGDEVMVTKFKVEELNSLLRSLLDVSPDFETAALVSSDGFVIASQMPEGTSDEKLGAMSAAILSLGERASQELSKGNLETVFVEGKNGYVLLSSVSDDMLLVVGTSKYAKLGLVFYELNSLKKSIAELVSKK